MEQFPTVVDCAESAAPMGAGHLWILEAVEGEPLRFSLQADGQLVFGDEQRRLQPDEIEPWVEPAVETVRTRFRRDAFRSAVEDVAAVTFFGIATCQHRLAYDWDRLPAFVGYDVHAPGRGGLLAPDAAHASFDRLGLTPAPAVEREVRADSFAPDRATFPQSAWAPQPCAGLRLSDKHGWRGTLSNPDRPPSPTADFETPAAAAESLVTVELVAALGEVDAVYKRLARAHRAELASANVDPADGAFRAAVAETVQRRR